MTQQPKTIKRMQELADLAGVSRATVSRALSNSELISKKTRDRIHALAKKHSYQVNQSGRDFRLRQSRVVSVALMLDSHSDQHMSDPFFLEMLGSIADCLAEHDYDMLLAHAPIKDLAALQDTRMFRQAAGVIFVGQSDQHERLNELARQGMRMVVWGAPVEGKDYCLIGGKNFEGGILATQHLIDQGAKKIAFFGNAVLPEAGLRYKGYCKALQDNGMKAKEQLLLNVPFEMNGARESIMNFLELGADFDAAVCASDVIALSAITTLSEFGLKIPHDVAIVGYDDIALAEYSSPPLSSIRQNIRWAGRVLVESLMSLINNEPVADTTLESELIVRRSSLRV